MSITVERSLARFNPFRSERVEALAFRPQGEDWPAILARLDCLRHRAAIVGPKGHGKTTMLLELGLRLEADGWRAPLVRLSEETPRPDPTLLDGLIRTADGRTIVLLDGAEQLGAWAWHRLCRRLRRAGGLVITTHRPGRLPTLHACRTSPALLDELIGILLAETPNPALADLSPESLYRACGGDLRQALMRLYRCHAGV